MTYSNSRKRPPSAMLQLSCGFSPSYLALRTSSERHHSAWTLVEQSVGRDTLPWESWEPSALSWVKELPRRHLRWCQTIWAPFRRNLCPGDISPTASCLFEEQGEGEGWLPWKLCRSEGNNVWLFDAMALPDIGLAVKQEGQFKHLIIMHVPSPRIHTFHCLGAHLCLLHTSL